MEGPRFDGLGKGQDRIEFLPWEAAVVLVLGGGFPWCKGGLVGDEVRQPKD